MDDDNWDLHAVVRSCCRASPSSSHGGRDLHRDPTHSSTPLTSPRTLHNAFHELEEVCRPFFVAPTQHMLDVRSPSSLAPRQKPLGHVPARSKRRKSQMKRVVCEVPADGVCSDVWAWRKYGQKPIKGSPFPRGYYKCSSSKGCPARKLVERSRTDPGTISVTYMGEHNHAAPAHRNCLAGSTRNNKQPVTSSPPSNMSDAIVGGLSPTTPLTATEEEEMEMFVGLGEELDDEVMEFGLYDSMEK